MGRTVQTTRGGPQVAARLFIQGKTPSKVVRNCKLASTRAVLHPDNSVSIRYHSTDTATLNGDLLTLDNSNWPTRSSADSMSIALGWINDHRRSLHADADAPLARLEVVRRNWEWVLLDGDDVVFSFGPDLS